MLIKILMTHFKNGDIKAFSDALKQENIDIQARDENGKTILMCLVSTPKNELPAHHLDMLRVLIHQGGKALINAIQRSTQSTALMYAAEANYREGVLCLLDSGADINLKDYLGRNALSSVLNEPSFLTAQALVDRGIEVSNEIACSVKSDQIISDLLWGALLTMPEIIPEDDREAFYKKHSQEDQLSLTIEPISILRQNADNYLILAKKHNEDLPKHPEVTGRAVAEQIPLLPKSVAILVSCYIYQDEKSLDNFDMGFNDQKSIMFSGQAANEAQNKLQNIGHRQIKVVPDDEANFYPPSLSYEKKRLKRKRRR